MLPDRRKKSRENIRKSDRVYRKKRDIRSEKKEDRGTVVVIIVYELRRKDTKI